MVFSSLNTDPRDTLKLAVTECKLWEEAQLSETKQGEIRGEIQLSPVVREGMWCYLDGSWKKDEIYSGQGWYSTLEGFDGLMGGRNTRAAQSPLHSEIEALIWAMECMRNLRQYRVTFATDCSQLVKMVSKPEEWPAFANYLTDIKMLQGSFHSSELIHIPRSQNTKADSLARCARKQSSFVIHMDAELLVWFTESR